MAECTHNEAVYWPVGEGFERRCVCGLLGTGRTMEETLSSFLMARMRAGERLTMAEEARVAFTPAPFGTKPSCHHHPSADHARSFLLGSA